MVAWSADLSEYDIRYEPRGPIKSQALAYFSAELVEGNVDAQPENDQPDDAATRMQKLSKDDNRYTIVDQELYKTGL